MDHQFKIKTENQPAVVERLLRVVRHRGFELTNLNAEVSSDELNINLAVTGQRSIHLLSNQLSKLIDVKALELQLTDSEHQYKSVSA